ncbi:MAG: DHH family phosphoesterase, partial [Ruminococcus sp.]
MKLWTVSELNKAEASEIQNKYELPAIVAMLLQIRNIKSQDEIEDFLFNDSEIASPFEIKDMDKAVIRIKTALDNDELICVYGDYDADGVTSTALLYSYFDAIGANAMYYIPSRETEGYGMNNSAVDFLKEKGVRLIVTVDNGIAALNEIDYASSLGIDTVVTDHHMPTGKLPDACAVVDLHRQDCQS